MPQGTVRWFDTDRGFGFIAPADGADDIYVHATELDPDGPRVLREGQEVEFEVGEGDRGPQARSVRVTAEAPAGTLGVLGTVSWYEPAKGYGFATPDGGGGEVFVHSSSIVGGGVVHEGQRVAFLVVDGEKGPQADHLLPLAAEAAGAAAAGGADGGDGTVSWFDGGKGFGFITPDDGGPDVFAHVRELDRSVDELGEGDRVTYEVVEGDRGPQARGIKVVGGGRRGGGRGRDHRGDRDGGRRGGFDRDGGRDRRNDRDGGRRGAPARGDNARGGSARGGSARGGSGEVVRFDPDRGFGFIRPDGGGDDLFVHVSVVRGGVELYEGDRVRFQVRQSDRGPQADRVELD